MTAWKEMVVVAETLRSRGYAVELPDGVEEIASGARFEESAAESVANKQHGDLIRAYYEEIKASDAVLIVNTPKHGRDGYIGGNVFLEFAFGHVLGKPVYLLYDYDHSSSYADEMEAMGSTILNGNIDTFEL